MISTVPCVLDGLTAVICVSETTLNEGAMTLPNRMAVAFVKYDPVRVTDVPPLVEPLAGVTPVTTGIGVR